MSDDKAQAPERPDAWPPCGSPCPCGSGKPRQRFRRGEGFLFGCARCLPCLPLPRKRPVVPVPE